LFFDFSIPEIGHFQTQGEQYQNDAGVTHQLCQLTELGLSDDGRIGIDGCQYKIDKSTQNGAHSVVHGLPG